MGAPGPGKRQRRWAPKSRRACTSCKQRRLRCDESKPTCLRCVKDGFACEWDVHAVATAAPRTTGCNDAEPSAQRASIVQHAKNPVIATTNVIELPPAKSAITHTTFHQHCKPESATSASVLTTYRTPSSPYSQPADYNYLSYFLLNVAPLLSTTKSWRTLWQTTIPQCAWTSEAVRHGMIAVAASYEGFTSEIRSRPRRSGRPELKDEAKLVVMKEINAAIGAFRRHEGQELDIALLLCRILAGAAQAQGDWRLASAHLAWGARMLRQASSVKTRLGNARGGLSEIVKTMAPTFMGVLNESLDDRDGVDLSHLSEEKARIWKELLRFRASYKEYFQKWIDQAWSTIDRKLQTYLGTAWSTINHAVSSARYPDLVCFGEDHPVKPVPVVYQGLMFRAKLYDLDELAVIANAMLEDMDSFIYDLPGQDIVQSSLEERLKTCFDNYLVQAAIFEPQMSAGTFWSDRPDAKCNVLLLFERHRPGDALTDVSAKHKESSRQKVEEEIDEERNFCIEHVCAYRSGITPVPCDGDLCCLTTDVPFSLTTTT